MRSVRITNGGRGYAAPPTVTFSAAPSGGDTATAVAELSSGSDPSLNLFWARQTLSGKELVVTVGGA